MNTTEQLTSQNILSLFETNKEQRKSFVTDLIERIQDESADPLKVHLQIKAMEDIITQLTSTDEKKNKNLASALTYKAHLLAAAEKYGQKFDLHNASFKISEVGTKYDFSNTGDTELAELYLIVEETKLKIKAKEDFLKTVPLSGLDIRIGDELVTVYPPAKTSTTSVSVTLK